VSVACAQEMQRRGQGTGVDQFAVQPGLVGTPLLNLDPGKMDPWKPAALMMWAQVSGLMDAASSREARLWR
jgi:hypothetical protein